jgi:hypothetical protein
MHSDRDNNHYSFDMSYECDKAQREQIAALGADDLVNDAQPHRVVLRYAPLFESGGGGGGERDESTRNNNTTNRIRLKKIKLRFRVPIRTAGDEPIILILKNTKSIIKYSKTCHKNEPLEISDQQFHRFERLVDAVVTVFHEN